MTGGQKFCLRWDGFKSRLSSVFDELRREEELLDVTLCCDGGHAVKAHQILLSASSPSLRQLLKSNPCQHPVFFLKETSAEDLHAIIQFIYCGEVNVVQSQLASFIKTAEMLQIRGLSGDSDGDEDQTEQVDLSDDEGPSMDDPLGFFSSFEGHVDAGSAAGPSSRDSHGGPSTAAGPSGQAGATAAGEPTAQEGCRSLRKTRGSNQRQSSDANVFAVIDLDKPPKRSLPRARFKNFKSAVEASNLEFLTLLPEEDSDMLPLTEKQVLTPELDVHILPSSIIRKLARRDPLSKNDWREMMNSIHQRYSPYDHYIRKARHWYVGLAQSIIDQFPFALPNMERQDALAVIDFDESPRRPVPPAPFKNFRIRQTRYWYLGMAQSIIDQFPFVFSHLNRRDAMGLVARRLKNKFKNSRRISTNKNEMRHGLSGLDDSPGSSVARRNSDENATEASNDPNITSLEQQSDGSTGAKGSDVTTNKAPQIPDIDQVSDHGSEELSTADDVDVLDEAS
ncbi:Broad-complex core protein isoforms 1/2/3/4/5 [Amphibalanus amphitrite]|uniref:Broad-complex core protein isoforms 1/2/3/4/5 n=1 Tax=Amphibalanus amphitrite TaxID=1232801 RepID=A0A6A4WH61_AMPAM|nr:Broad-complex core protein isoforms 1/2/3/4/5 [Amphibalanus amphitrite]KAF0302142.1 Broad-complex core protein isoforms 1/2/3/4/5 [Amphibalanus amphitrite]